MGKLLTTNCSLVIHCNVRRATVSNAEKYKERESIKEEKLREIVEGPKPVVQSSLNADEEVPSPSPAAAMETEDNLPEYVLLLLHYCMRGYDAYDACDG